MSIIKIPNDREFISNLILQKTGYFLDLGGAEAFQKWNAYGDKAGLVEFLEVTGKLDLYLELVIEELTVEFNQLRAYIPKKNFEKIVSIGPGNGLFELLLVQEGLTSEILLIDIEHTDYHYHGYNEKGSGYANLNATEVFIKSNINTDVTIICCNPNKQRIPDFEFTLLISLLSMGFHYPCLEYSDFIVNNSALSATIIFDKRNNVFDEGYNQLEKNFGIIHEFQSPKSTRLIMS